MPHPGWTLRVRSLSGCAQTPSARPCKRSRDATRLHCHCSTACPNNLRTMQGADLGEVDELAE
eukprot:7669850-Lingulodinium_polyedra.AAC.1